MSLGFLPKVSAAHSTTQCDPNAARIPFTETNTLYFLAHSVLVFNASKSSELLLHDFGRLVLTPSLNRVSILVEYEGYRHQRQCDECK